LKLCCIAGNRNCSQIDSGIGDICTLPLDGSMMHSRFMENGHLNKLAAAKPPPTEHFPIRVEDLEDYIMSRRNSNNEELRNEYRVSCDFMSSLFFVYSYVPYICYYFCRSLSVSPSLLLFAENLESYCSEIDVTR